MLVVQLPAWLLMANGPDTVAGPTATAAVPVLVSAMYCATEDVPTSCVLKVSANDAGEIVNVGADWVIVSVPVAAPLA
jgi:hypothetical protein